MTLFVRVDVSGPVVDVEDDSVPVVTGAPVSVVEETLSVSVVEAGCETVVVCRPQ